MHVLSYTSFADQLAAGQLKQGAAGFLYSTSFAGSLLMGMNI